MKKKDHKEKYTNFSNVEKMKEFMIPEDFQKVHSDLPFGYMSLLKIKVPNGKKAKDLKFF